MARHNREARGTDQRGFEYQINYPPDWLRYIKVTRDLESGRQSTKTLFRNPASRGERDPGDQRRLTIRSLEQELEFEVVVGDADQTVRSISVTCSLEREDGRPDEVSFRLEGGLPIRKVART